MRQHTTDFHESRDLPTLQLIALLPAILAFSPSGTLTLPRTKEVKSAHTIAHGHD